MMTISEYIKIYGGDLQLEDDTICEVDYRMLREWGELESVVLKRYHHPSDALCGSCGGLLDAHKDALCELCHAKARLEDAEKALDRCSAANRMLEKDVSELGKALKRCELALREMEDR